MNSKIHNYQTLTNALNVVLAKLQNGELDVDEATEAFETGMKLINKIEKHLELAEIKITKIQKEFDSKRK